MKSVAVQILIFGFTLLLVMCVYYFTARANYRKESPKLDEPTRNAWAATLRRFAVIGTSIAVLLLIAGISIYLASQNSGSGAPLRLGISFPMTLLGITILLGIGSYVFMTYKLHEHQINGNEQYARDVAMMRTKVAGLFLLFSAIQFMSLILHFLR